MIHRVIRLQQHHVVIERQLLHLGSDFLASHEKDIRHFGHFGRPDGLQVAQAGHQQHAGTVERKDVAHQIAGKGAHRLVV